MKKTFLLIALLISCISNLTTAQEFKMINSDEAQMIDEIQGFAIKENNKVLVGFIPPSEQRAKEYQKLDLQKDDEILFVNGKKVKSMSDFKTYYGELKPGDEVKFGIKRNNQPMIITFKKGEVSKGMKIMTITSDGKSGDGKAKIEGGKMIINGKKIDLDSLKKSGAKVQFQK